MRQPTADRRLPVAQRFRGRLAGVSLALLLCQGAGALAAPVTACARPTSASAGDAAECTCTHGPDAVCPMHHRRPTTPRRPSRDDCRCSSPAAPAAPTPATTSIDLALPIAEQGLERPVDTYDILSVAARQWTDYVRPPFSPPPRS